MGVALLAVTLAVVAGGCSVGGSSHGAAVHVPRPRTHVVRCTTCPGALRPAASAARSPTRRPAPEPVRVRVRVWKDVTYAVVNDTPLRLDVVAPDDHGNSRRAGVIVLHGGAWRSGDKADVHDAAEMLAAHGFVAFAVNYRKTCARHEHGDRLCGVHVSQSVDDTYRALDWIRSHAARFGAAPRRVGVLGMSAGGHLAEMLGVRARRHRGHVDAVVAWSAPLPDLREFNSDPHPLRMVGCRPEECPLRWAAISPDTYASPGDAPTMIVNSTAELVPRQSATYLALKLRYAHVPVRLLLLPGTRHASQYASVAWGPTLAFLRKWLRPQAHQ